MLAAWGVPQLPVGSQIVTNAAAALVPQVSAALPQPGGRVAVLLPTGNEAIRVMPIAGPVAGPNAAPSGPLASTARGLDSYRATPITFTNRPGRAF